MARISVLARVWRSDGPLGPPLTAPAISQSLHSSLGISCRAAAQDSTGGLLLRGECERDVWPTVRDIRSLWVGAIQLSLALEEDRISAAAVSTTSPTLLELVDAAGGTPPSDAPGLLLHMLNPRLAARSLKLTHLGDVSPGRPILQLAHTDEAAAAGGTPMPLDAASAELCSAPLLVRGRAVRLQAVTPGAAAVAVAARSGSSAGAGYAGPGSSSQQQQQLAHLQSFMQPSGSSLIGECISIHVPCPCNEECSLPGLSFALTSPCACSSFPSFSYRRRCGACATHGCGSCCSYFSFCSRFCGRLFVILIKLSGPHGLISPRSHSCHCHHRRCDYRCCHWPWPCRLCWTSSWLVRYR